MKNSFFVRVLGGGLPALAFALFAMTGPAAAETFGIGLPVSATDSAQRIHEFHDMLLVIITGIVIFVLALLLYVIARFNAKANPVPSKTTHNVMLEIVWTIIPVVILIIIAVPSFQLLYKNERIENPEMTIKITGAQWYWIYDYPDHGDINFTSYMIPNNKIDQVKGEKRLLSTDNKVVLPVGVTIQALVTSGPTDVIHSWAMPRFGIKTDAVPGRNHKPGPFLAKEDVDPLVHVDQPQGYRHALYYFLDYRRPDRRRCSR
jgi:cytochrome c oxidase subunit 2